MSVFDELVAVASDLGILSRSVAQAERTTHQDRVTMILSGSVALLAPGGDLLATIAGPGDILGAEAFSGQRSPLRGIWMTAGRVLEIKPCDLPGADDPERQLRWLGQASVRMQDALAREVACRVEHGITERMANLVSILSEHEHASTVRATQVDLARLLGVQRTSVCAAMMALKQRGLARVRRGKMEVMDAAGLREAACGCGTRRSFVGQELYSPVGVSWGGVRHADGRLSAGH